MMRRFLIQPSTDVRESGEALSSPGYKDSAWYRAQLSGFVES